MNVKFNQNANKDLKCEFVTSGIALWVKALCSVARGTFLFEQLKLPTGCFSGKENLRFYCFRTKFHFPFPLEMSNTAYLHLGMHVRKMKVLVAWLSIAPVNVHKIRLRTTGV